MAEAADAYLFEIKPEVPYTSADLDWQDKNSRSSVEMRDKSSRPAIAESNVKVGEYDVIFVGFAGGIIGLNQEKPINRGFALI